MGDWRWVETSASPRFSATQEFLGLVGTVSDITDRKRAEQNFRFLSDINRDLGSFSSVQDLMVKVAVDIG